MPINPPRPTPKATRVREVARRWSLALTRYAWLVFMASWTASLVALLVVSAYPYWYAVLLGYALGLLAAANLLAVSPPRRG